LDTTQSTRHFRPLHKIFILDAVLEGLLDESDPRGFCEGYFEEIMEATHMKPLSQMSVCPTMDPRAPGFSGVQPLTTSHTSFHYFWEPEAKDPRPNVHLDLYSCSPFSYEDVVRVAHKHFRLAEWTGTFIDRDLDPRKRLTLQLRGREDAILEQFVLTTGKETRARIPAMVR
jgi:hypothetical protein